MIHGDSAESLDEKLDQAIHEYREKSAKTVSMYNAGLMTSDEERNRRVRTAVEAFQQIKEFCSSQLLPPTA